MHLPFANVAKKNVNHPGNRNVIRIVEAIKLVHGSVGPIKG
jgi:hypothetical protein